MPDNLPDSLPDVTKAEPQRLAQLFAIEESAERVWSPAELPAVLQHQLASSIRLELPIPGEEPVPGTATALECGGYSIKDFNELFHHPQPPVELLRLAKEFGKVHLHHPHSPIPREVASVLYYASIVAALTRCQERITSLDDAALRKGIHWVLEQAWVDDRLRTLFREGLSRLASRESG